MDFDNIGDFLYLILLVVFSIFGLIGKKKKGAQSTGKPSKPFFETILNMGQDDDEEFEPKPSVVESAAENDVLIDTYEPVGKPTIKPSRYLKELVTDDGFKSTGKKGVAASIIKESEIGSDTEGVIPNFNNSLEIKRGIIFSELINPKYLEM